MLMQTVKNLLSEQNLDGLKALLREAKVDAVVQCLRELSPQ
jgi:hypothetical protein